MSKTLTPITNLGVSTPVTLIALANSLVAALDTETVTVNTYSTGAVTTGNGTVSGTFGATSLFAGNLRGGSVSASANLAISSNAVVNSQSYITVGNTQVNSTAINVDSIAARSASVNNFTMAVLALGNTSMSAVEISTSGLSIQNVDSIQLSVNRSAEYLASVKSNSANAYQLTKLLMVHDGTSAYITEYGMVSTNTTNPSVGTFSTTANATHAILQYTPAYASVTLRINKLTVGV